MFKNLFNMVLMLFFTSPALASNFRLLELDTFAMEFSEIGDLRDPYYPYASPRSDSREKWRGTVATEFNLALLAYKNYGLFFDNRIAGDGTNKQFRTVSWEWTTRLQLFPSLYLFHYHLSEHILEAASPHSFPLRNRFGVHITMYERK